jgi:FkbM family methyltransferase
MSRSSSRDAFRSVLQTTHKLLWAIEDRRTFWAILTWPKFSLSSFLIVSRIARLGIRPRTILDVGANVGQFAVAAAKVFADARIYSFEPNPEVVPKLRATVYSLPNVTVHEFGLGDVHGELEFFVNRDSQVSSFLPLGERRREAFPDSTVERTTKVPVRTLDSVFAETHMEGPVMLKIDVQGFEDRVLKGGLRALDAVDHVVMETAIAPLYDGEIDIGEAMSMMYNLGYTLRQPLHWHWSPIDGSIIEMDLLFERQKVGMTK